MRLRGEAKEAVTVISQLQQQRANPEISIPYMKVLWNWQRNSKFNRASRSGKQRDREQFPTDTPCQYWKRALDLPTIHGPLAAGNEHIASGNLYMIDRFCVVFRVLFAFDVKLRNLYYSLFKAYSLTISTNTKK